MTKEELINWFRVKKNIKQWQSVPPEKHYPWITIDAILFLTRYIEWLKSIGTHPFVWEFGGGSSTIFFTQKACQIHTVEHDEKWAMTMGEYIRKHGLFGMNDTLEYHPQPYHKACEGYHPETVDIILSDGYSGGRFSCFKNSLYLLKPDGILIFDDIECERNRKGIAEFASQQGLYTYRTKMKKIYQRGKKKKTKVTNIYFRNPELIKFGDIEE